MEYGNGSYYDNGYTNWGSGGGLDRVYQERAKKERKEIRQLGTTVGLSLTLYLLLNLIVSLLLSVSPTIRQLYYDSAVFDYAVNIIGVEIICIALPFGLMAWRNREKYEGGNIVPQKKISAGDTALWVGAGMLVCIVTNIVISLISAILAAFGTGMSGAGSTASLGSAFGCIMCLLSLAVVAPICEEFAMRCCCLGITKKYGRAFSVVCVSIVFGVMHGNLTQFIMAFCVGLFLGYVTVKTDNILPAMITHAANNLISGLYYITIYLAGSSETGLFAWFGRNCTSICFIFWLVAGIICVLILYRRGMLRREPKKQKQPYENSTGKKVLHFFLTPAMILPALEVIYFIFFRS